MLLDFPRVAIDRRAGGSDPSNIIGVDDRESVPLEHHKGELAPFSTLQANSSGYLVKPLKSRNAGGSERVAIKPVDKT